MIKISIIVPIYNAENYLSKCLESLVRQTFKNIEIILIDDCSTDNSKKIIEEYIKLYTDKIIARYLNINRRQGYARNLGIDISSGDYILFVDSDDYISENMCEVLYRTILKYEYDIICFDWNEVNKGEIITKRLSYDSFCSRKIDKNLRKKIIESKGYFWTRIYKKELIVQNKIKFPEKINYEDSLFNTLTLLYAKSIAKIDKSLYFYNIRNGSSSNCYNEKRLYYRITVTELMLNEVKNRNLYNEFREIVNKKYFRMMIGNIHLCLDMFDKIDLKKMRQISICINKNFKNYNNMKEYIDLDKVSKVYLILNNKCPRILVIVDKLYKKILNIIRA